MRDVEIAAHAYGVRTACLSLHSLKISYVFIRKIGKTPLEYVSILYIGFAAKVVNIFIIPNF